MNNYFLTRYFFARQLTLFSLPFDSNYTTLINVFYFQMNIIKVYYYTDPRQLFVVVSSSILWLMKIIHRNEFFVLFLILFVRTNYIDLHHFILVILLSFNINRFFAKFTCTQHCISAHSKWPSSLSDSIEEIWTYYKCFFKTTFGACELNYIIVPSNM